MGLITGWYRFDSGALPRGIVIADATSAAAGLWEGPIASILEEIAEQLPSTQHPDVVFLGDRRTYPIAGVLCGLVSNPPAADTAVVDVKGQFGRYPVAGPILHNLQKGPARSVLLLLNGPVIDLDDWAVPELARHALVYRLTGAARVSPDAFVELGPADDLATVVTHLADPLRSVRFGGPTAVALDWDVEAYQWASGELVHDGPLQSDVCIQFIHPEGFSPEAVVKRASGVGHHARLVMQERPHRPQEVALPPAEGNVFGMWERKAPFYCLRCQRDHPPGQIRCLAPGSGPGLLPTFSSLPATPAYLVRGGGGRWSVIPIPRGIVALPDGHVLARRNGTTTVLGFETDRWVPRPADSAHFIPIGEGQFVVLA